MSMDIYTAPASKRAVAINSNAERAVFLKDIDMSELKAIIIEFERIRIAEFWDDSILTVSNYGTWLNGFQFSDASPVYFSVGALRDAVSFDDRGRAVIEHARQLPLERQREILSSMRPENRAGLQTMTAVRSAILGPDFLALATSLGNPTNFVNSLISELNANTCAKYHSSRYIELLTMLWDKGFILFPPSVLTWVGNQKWSLILCARYSPQKTRLVTLANPFAKKGVSDMASSYLTAFFTIADVTTVADLSTELVAAYRKLADLDAMQRCKSPIKIRDATGRVQAVANALLLLYNSANPNSIAPIIKRPKSKSGNTAPRVDGTFRWLAERRPGLAPWADAFFDFVGQLTIARISGHIDSLNYFGDYLCSLEKPPLPFEIRRALHVYDAARLNQSTFAEFLRTLKVKDRRRKTAFSRMRQFFDWFIDSLPIDDGGRVGLTNPFFSTDSVGGADGGPGQTSRDALPSYILNEMKAVITENDFAFSRRYLDSDVTVFDKQIGAMVKTWFPALPVCLYLMLEAPIRAHQARWLDSGLLDESSYEVSSSREMLNKSPYAIRGRRESALRLQGDVTLSDKWLSLWINTNKTAVYDSGDVGYSIPYVSEEATALISLMVDWQRRYMPPLTTPVSYFKFDAKFAERARLKGTGPQIAPLFRDPTSASHEEPVSYARLGRFYTAVLAETQDRIQVKYGKSVTLVKDIGGGKVRWAVDLHSLRVSGITAMIESGVPLEVVSQFVAGHATLVMTLHYLKYSPKKLRQFLFEAHERMKNDTSFLESNLFYDNLDVFQPFLLGQDGQGGGAGFKAFKEQSGLLSITADGICPGTSCSTGGPKLKGGFAPVPGGQRCGLCRYWLTGPAHLLGQVASVNNLAYMIRKKGLEVATLQDEKIDAEDVGDSREMRRLRDRIELLNRELAIDVEEWTARYNYATRSVSLIDSYLASRASVEGSAPQLPVLTRGTASELKVTLEQSHEFALLDQITQMSDFVTGFTNTEAGLEKNHVLSKMMTANGISPFLLNLNDKQAHEAGNLLSALVLQQVRAQELDEVLSGNKPLAHYPTLDRTVRALSQHASEIKLGSVAKLEEVAESVLTSQPTKTVSFEEEMFG